MYYLDTDLIGNQTIVRVVSGDEVEFIPVDSANADYQQYLAWLEEGNVPEEWNPDQSSDIIEGDS